MNENLDLTQILEGCPKGTEFYHLGYGKVWLTEIDLDDVYPIRLSTLNDDFVNVTVTKEGFHSISYPGECLLFPSKDQRDWSKFERFWDKPKVERFDPKTLQPFDKVLVRDYSNRCWGVEIFGYIDKLNGCRCTAFWDMCIPYNDETKHLVGTKEDCPEYYKWWEEEQ